VRSARPVAALFAGLVLMVAAWAAATPLGQAADEPAHYIKALAAGRGHVHGTTPDVANLDALAALVRQERRTESRAAQARALNFIGEASGAWVAVAWALLLAVLVATAARRQRRLALLVVVSIVVVAAYATCYLTSGFDEFYGRYALPALVVLPLCAGAILAERGPHLADSARTRLVVAFTLATGAIQLLAWWLESRRLAVGTNGPFYFLGDATWTPPGGWALWVGAMLVGTGLYVSSGLSSRPTPALRR
jgi:peptidoglycan/LPS O-acetylase OafA/YrhL